MTFLFVYKAKIHPISFFHFKTSKRMDVTSDKDLFDFIESLGKEEEKYSTIAATATTIAAVHNNTNSIDTAAAVSDSSIISDQDLTESVVVDVWQDIADALNNWSERILSIESRYTNKVAFKKQLKSRWRGNNWTVLYKQRVD